MKKGSVLTACYFESAGLPVHRVELEVHGAGEGQGDSDAVEDVAVWKDSGIFSLKYFLLFEIFSHLM